MTAPLPAVCAALALASPIPNRTRSTTATSAPIPVAQLDDALVVDGDPVRARSVRSRLSVPVTIDGKGPFSFLVDSAADRSVISRGAARRLGLPQRGCVRLHSLAGTSLAAVPQQVLAARIGWTESRVTKELGAARAFAEAHEFAALHLKADNPPIDYLYKVQQALEAAVKDDAEHPKRSPEKSAVGKLKAKLEALLVKPERFATAEALAKLGIGAAPKVKPGKTDQIADGVSLAAGDPEIIGCIDGADGEPIAIVEKTQDDQLSIRLMVDVAGMDERQKGEARSKLREAIDKLLG